VLQASDGMAGMRIVQSSIPLSLLIADVGLPGINGRQLAEAARARRADLPVLLITGYAGRAADEAGLPPGVDVVRKPFALDELTTRVRAMLEDEASRRAGEAPLASS
jgi:DNA-binding response OmpR family regulator